MTGETIEPRCSHCGQPFPGGVKHCGCPTQQGYRKNDLGEFETIRALHKLPMPLVETAALHLAAAALDIDPAEVSNVDQAWFRKAISLLRALGL